MQALNTELTFGLADPLPAGGLHSGFVRIPYSSNRSTYGFVPLPVMRGGGCACWNGVVPHPITLWY